MNKIYSISELQEKLKEIELDLKNNWSAWGDASPSAREETIRKLARIRRYLSKPLRIDISKSLKDRDGFFSGYKFKRGKK